MPVEDVKRLGRSTQGVIVMRLRDGEKVSTLAPVIDTGDERMTTRPCWTARLRWTSTRRLRTTSRTTTRPCWTTSPSSTRTEPAALAAAFLFEKLCDRRCK